MPVLSPQESSKILSTLEDSALTFRKALEYFLTNWPSPSSTRFQAACYILLALEEGILCQAGSRLQALQILFHISEGQTPGKSPFLPFLLQASQDSSRPRVEQTFIQFLFQGGLDLDSDLLKAVQDLQQANIQFLPSVELWAAYARRSDQATTSSRGDAEGQEESRSPSGMQMIQGAGSSQLLSPPYIRHRQGIMKVQHREVLWQHMQLPHFLRWDFSMAKNQISLKELQSLLKSALLKPLLPSQQQQVLKELELERRLVLSLDLATDAVPQLVEHNPVIAFEVLVRLIQLGCGKEYLPSLVGMEVSVHSMEVINRLSTAASLPSQFVHLYISNCIRSCQAAQDDKYMQLRRVRLVCVFLQSLIRNQIINVQDLSFEAQAFCIEFSRVREAAALFRLLKTLENGEATFLA